MMPQDILKSIDEASKVIGKTWPLYSFVTSNPLSGYEQTDFKTAVETASSLMNTNMFPEAALFRQAWDQGEIEEGIVMAFLLESGYTEAPDFYLRQMESHKVIIGKNKNHILDGMMSKWLSVFMDEGLAEWEMPGKEAGFYKAWRQLAAYDQELGIRSVKDIPKSSGEALQQVLNGQREADYVDIFTYHLASLPGWTGYINYRSESNSLWQQAYPITMEDYLAVRLWIANQLNLAIVPESNIEDTSNDLAAIQYIWLKAWESTWQQQLVASLEQQTPMVPVHKTVKKTPDAQMAFCIDTRSELIRRHVETKGNYETFGYAGFFGIAMDYSNLEDGLNRKSCPPIVTSAYLVSEAPQSGKKEKALTFKRKNDTAQFGTYFLKRMKNMLPSAFGFVEGSGFFYGCYLLIRTLAPGTVYRFKKKNIPSYEDICTPELRSAQDDETLQLNIPVAEKAGIVKSAFDLTGWQEFAPLILFVGHGGHSANNAFDSSLDCGACAASPGRHNARMLASLANETEVRIVLAEKHKVDIPDSTVFIGAEHNTTTDEIELFDAHVPSSHKEQLAKVKSNLALAQQTATQDRLGIEQNSVKIAERKANQWSETRPEWGLAKNAGFIVGPRSLTQKENLDGRCFLHSYNWKLDETGAALEGIMQGPMVVTQWINNHYYFSMVDNDTFGGGSKITHNITGRFGVVQGNGGDLKMGLPLQSLRSSDTEMYHKPLRLSVLIQAPKARIEDILSRNENLRTLLDNEWIYLMVMNPLKDDRVEKYQKGMSWVPVSGSSFISVKNDSKARAEVI
ncbi:MAG: hypothetical protein ACJAU2_000432 [Maribacter sp.]|jgi:uncharacterized protein YbcC (UPF0753/DUF2309 family)